MRLKFSYFLIVITVAFAGCKKNMTDHQLTASNTAIERIQAWFSLTKNAEQPKPAAFHFRSTTVQWKDARHFAEADTYIIPIKIGNSGSADLNRVAKFLIVSGNANDGVNSGYFCYILCKTGKPGISPSLLTGTNIPLDFNGAIVKYNMDGSLISAKHYKDGVLTDKQDKVIIKENAGMGTGQSIVPEDCGGGMVCIDWYWQTYVNGELVDEEYLFTDCECEGDGSGTGGANGGSQCAAASNAFINSGATSNEILSGTVVSESDLTKVDDWNWKIFSAGTWGIISYDRVTWTRPSQNLAWTYSNYMHITDSEIGTSIGGSRTYTILHTEAQNYVSSVVIKIIFNVKHQPVCKNVPFIDPVTQVFTANQKFKPKNTGVVMTP